MTLRLPGRFLKTLTALLLATSGAFLPIGGQVALASNIGPELVSQSSSGQTADGSVDTNGGESHIVLSADGRYSAFASNANNLGGQRAGIDGLYLRDRLAGTTTLISVNSAGQQE